MCIRDRGLTSSTENTKLADSKIAIICESIGLDLPRLLSNNELRKLWKKYDLTHGERRSAPAPLTQPEAAGLFNELLSKKGLTSNHQRQLSAFFKVQSRHHSGWPQRFVVLEHQKATLGIYRSADAKGGVGDPIAVLPLKNGRVSLHDTKLTIELEKADRRDSYNFSSSTSGEEELQLWYVHLHRFIQEQSANADEASESKSESASFVDAALDTKYLEVVRRDNLLQYGFDTLLFAEVAFTLLQDHENDDDLLEWDEIGQPAIDRERFKQTVKRELNPLKFGLFDKLSIHEHLEVFPPFVNQQRPAQLEMAQGRCKSQRQGFVNLVWSKHKADFNPMLFPLQNPEVEGDSPWLQLLQLKDSVHAVQDQPRRDMSKELQWLMECNTLMQGADMHPFVFVNRVYSYPEGTPQSLHVVLEAAPHYTLRQQLEHIEFSQAERAMIVHTVTFYVAMLHHLGWAHCAINPDNILLDYSEEYGIQAVKVLPPLSHLLTDRELAMNTKMWRAPGNYDDAFPAHDLAARQEFDLWQLGLLAYFVQTGQSLLRPDTVDQQMDALRVDTSAIAHVAGGTMGSMEPFITRCCSGNEGISDERATTAVKLLQDRWLMQHLQLIGNSQIPADTLWRHLKKEAKEMLAYECLLIGIAVSGFQTDPWEVPDPLDSKARPIRIYAVQCEQFWDLLEGAAKVSIEAHIFWAKAHGLTVDQGGRIIAAAAKSFASVQHRVDRLCSFSPNDAIAAFAFDEGDAMDINGPHARTCLKLYVRWANLQRIFIYNTVLCYKDDHGGDLTEHGFADNHKLIIEAMDSLFQIINHLKPTKDRALHFNPRLMFQWHRRASRVKRVIADALQQLKRVRVGPIFDRPHWRTMILDKNGEVVPNPDYDDPCCVATVCDRCKGRSNLQCVNGPDHKDAFDVLTKQRSGASHAAVRTWVNKARTLGKAGDAAGLQVMLDDTYMYEKQTYVRGLTTLLLQPNGQGKVSLLLSEVRTVIMQASQVQWSMSWCFRQNLYSYLVLATFRGTVHWKPGLSHEMWKTLWTEENKLSSEVLGVEHLYPPWHLELPVHASNNSTERNALWLEATQPTQFHPSPHFGLDVSQSIISHLRDALGTVSYTHLTLPTKRIV
eukprot:TRINITY_DN18223_c0_g1_i1.p1 TRINITY_DN18223_c0_g1~~TRINITY_DN18223_c0_g1_i1.p1  ORF type:complete len:1117 (-),score=201.66 TRINITY_DN18223_c0_g1_i1:126-3476(-)